MSRRLDRALGRARRLLTRRFRAVAARGGFVLQPYRGYGSREEVFLIGRVFRQPTFGAGERGHSARRLLIEAARRLLSWGIAEAALVARFHGAEQRVCTDRDGYFRVLMRPARPPPADQRWHTMELELVEPTRIEGAGEVFLPPASCRYVVISDIDDTIMETGVASKIRMLWRLFMQGAESRVVFPGVAALLQALHRGASGVEANPMLYVSRAPWSLYEVLNTFFNLHRIPVGPILFLREWGLTLQSPLPRRAQDHKLELIRHILALYRELPFVLIGDSGQRDPEIYTRIVREHPGRALAIYIRNVSRDPVRHRAIGALASEVVAAGSSLLLAADSLAMAQHAAAHGLIAPGMLTAVAHERELEQVAPDLEPAVKLVRASASEITRAAQAGELEQALDQAGGAAPSQNVLVEAGLKATAPGVDERARGSQLRKQAGVEGKRREPRVRQGG